MSSNASKPSHSHYRPWFQNQADNAVSHITSQDAAAAESITDDDNVSMTYLEDTEPVDYADDEYDQSEEEEEQEDEERPDRPDEHYPGAPSGFHTSHHVYTGSYHHGFDLSAAVQPPSIYDLDESDASDEVVGHVLPVDYTAIADIITDDIDMDESFDTAGNFAPFNDGAVNYHQYPPQQDIDGILFSANPATSQWDVPGDVPPPEVESITSDNVDEVQQQLNQLGPGDEFEDGSTVWFPIPPPPPHAFISPNMSNLNPGNYPLVEFLQHWSFAGGSPKPRANRVTDLAGAQVTHVQYGDLAGDQCDMQGIDWEDLGVTRKDARERRLLTYRNYTNQQGSDRWHPETENNIPRTDSFFRFRRMDIRRNIHLSHFQLRNVVAAPSRTQLFYTGPSAVYRFNPVTGEGRPVMRLPDAPHSHVSTLAADQGVVVAGGFNGEYMVRAVGAEGEDQSSRTYDGTLTNHHSGITNHVQVNLSRHSSSPRAAFASNDQVFRVLDIETKTFVSSEAFNDPINCTAISPDRRLRVMVGDTNKVLIAAAESTRGSGRPEILQQLDGHRDFGFACDWADDGWTVATGFQDRLIKIWDARRWADTSGNGCPVETIRTQMAGVRSLHFSPIGSGKRVLVAAEEADFVNIIDAQTFRSKQTIDIFGEIGGTTFTNDGQDLIVLCTDRVRGGLIQLERCGLGAEASWDPDEDPKSLPLKEMIRWRGRTLDWPRNQFNEWKVIRESETRRRRKAANLDFMEPF